MTDPTHPPTWAEQCRILVDLAVVDLEAGLGVRPTVVAFRGDDPLFLATLRPFDKGAHLDPVIEVGALAAGLGADRLALSLSGRAWSLRDPIPPVLDEDLDLRQRVIVVHRADAADAEEGPVEGRALPVVLTTLVPYDLDGDVVCTGDAHTDEGGEGLVTQALAVMATHGRDVARDGVDVEDVGRQILRCEALGHQLAWASDQVALVERARLLPLGDCWSGDGLR